MSDQVTPDEIDGGMRAAYGKKEPRGESILAAIEALTGAVPRILLRDVSEDSSVLKVGADGAVAPGRYQIVGEIARGGVGVVLKGRDTDLGRDVAMKLLLERHVRNPEVLQRFVEEAQIGGQLQHPGIVPVYELGLNADKRPYFTMKLVKGRTLSEMLRKRESPDAARLRFLGIFRQVCETMAYAHARGVIHRDLKPANIMVGAFGEVQIVDWGFAKILSHGGVDDEARVDDDEPEQTVIETVRSGSVGSESRAGSVMGTPAYMPPEQALGKVEKLDERADVFALGAILTEILTGKPAYTGDGLLAQAAQAGLDDAHARLDACRADQDLVKLVKRCLAPARAARPEDASVLATAVDSYLTSVEERAHRADLAAEAALVKAAEERKARRLTVALAVAILIAVIAGAGGLYYVDREQTRRREVAAIPVRDALEEAALLRGEARAATLGDLSRWPQAFRAAERALRLAAASDTEDELERKARSFLDQLQGERVLAEERAQAALRDQRMVERLREILTWRGDDFEAGARERAYEDAFAEYGIDPGLPLPQSAIREELIAALDDREKYDQASAADPDPWRVKVRALAASDGDTLAKLADSRDLGELPPKNLALLGECLGRAGRVKDAQRVYRKAQSMVGDDFRVLFGLAWWLASGDEPDHQEAARFFQMAALLQPEGDGVAYHLGSSLLATRDSWGAIRRWREVHRRSPEFGKTGERLAGALTMVVQGHLFSRAFRSAVELCRESILLQPENAYPRMYLGRALMMLPDSADHVEEALAAFREAQRLAPDDKMLLRAFSGRLLQSRRYKECITISRLWIDACEDQPTAAAQAWQNTSQACLALGRYEEALAAAEKLRELGADSPLIHRTIGQIHAETGRFDAAIASVTTAIEKGGTAKLDTDTVDCLAHILRMKGDPVAAREIVQKHLAALEVRFTENPDDLNSKFEYARWLTRALDPALRDPDKALEMLNEVVERKPRSMNARLMRAFAQYRAGEYREAIPYLGAILRTSPPNFTVAEGQCYLAMCYWKTGQKEEAREVYQSATKYVETFTTSWMLHLLDVYAEAKRTIEGS